MVISKDHRWKERATAHDAAHGLTKPDRDDIDA